MLSHFRPMKLRGFSLIELLVSVGVLAILLAVAIPSFIEYRQRTSLRGALDQVETFWANARFEAVKRNSLLKVNVVSSGGQFCLGATTTTDPADTTACDCLTANACNVAAYPTAQAEWSGVRLSTVTLGVNTGVVVIDPKRGGLSQSGDAGSIAFLGSTATSRDYRLSAVVDRNGRLVVCEPAAAGAKLPQYASRRCQ